MPVAAHLGGGRGEQVERQGQSGAMCKLLAPQGVHFYGSAINTVVRKMAAGLVWPRVDAEAFRTALKPECTGE